jgi:hypothetical protein
MSRCVWALVDEEITEHMCGLDEGDARKWLAVRIETLRHDDQITVFVTLWAIWHARRKAIHEQIYQSPLSVHHFVESFMADLKQAGDSKRSSPTRTHAPASACPPRWIPPPAGVVKVNVDAAVSKNRGCGSVAAVARSDQGVFLGASTRVLPGKTEAETLEAMACREAVDLARDIGAQKVLVASDCRNVVANLEQGTMGRMHISSTRLKPRRRVFRILIFVMRIGCQIKRRITSLEV